MLSFGLKVCSLSQLRQVGTPGLGFLGLGQLYQVGLPPASYTVYIYDTHIFSYFVFDAPCI